MNPFRIAIFFLLVSIQNFAPNLHAAASSNQWVFIDNGVIRLGVTLASGAGIGWVSQSGSTVNLINHWDRGRLIQQSYYGNEDGSLWNKQPWRWNPVQGGDWRGSPARVLEIHSTATNLYSRTLPKHWASGQDLTNTLMEQWITLTGAVARVHYKFKYTGQTTHVKHDQEIPAVFVEPEFDTLVLCDAEKPWTGAPLSRSKPGWPNESRKMTQHWAAYVNRSNFGIGVFVPAAGRLTCYRFGDGKREHGSCSYFAPLTKFAITPGFVWEYDAYVMVGSIEEIRAAFARIAREGSATKTKAKEPDE